MGKTDGTDTLSFIYSPGGTALGFKYNGTNYFYLRNAQGDIVSIYDSTGTVVVNYTYDSWGKLLSTTGSLATTIGVVIVIVWTNSRGIGGNNYYYVE